MAELSTLETITTAVSTPTTPVFSVLSISSKPLLAFVPIRAELKENHDSNDDDNDDNDDEDASESKSETHTSTGYHSTSGDSIVGSASISTATSVSVGNGRSGNHGMKSISSGAVAGIAAGVVLGVAVVALGIFLLFRRRNRHKSMGEDSVAGLEKEPSTVRQENETKRKGLLDLVNRCVGRKQMDVRDKVQRKYVVLENSASRGNDRIGGGNDVCAAITREATGEPRGVVGGRAELGAVDTQVVPTLEISAEARPVPELLNGQGKAGETETEIERYRNEVRYELSGASTRALGRKGQSEESDGRNEERERKALRRRKEMPY
ncbi:hypothetical protein MKZ38_007140 [Zalerion maritima]|uniref:Uncharacterized protein n=1 Tax=Zalerion maritima TaxID=339359 RepID=A0AAD5RV38_9PEZI|nr:hypothetical protein MKZ38_007140 [Zalerion maritima]